MSDGSDNAHGEDALPREGRRSFLATAFIAWSCFVAAASSLPAGARLLAGLVSSLAFYRAAYFVHELAHFKNGSLPGFRGAWHLLAG